MFIVKMLIIEIIHSPSYLYEMERRGECAGQRKDRERVCVQVRGQLQFWVASVVKMAVRRTDHFGISQDKFRRIYINCKEVFYWQR
jgi:hypothetical protein